jgi:hypothetical protein
MACRSAISLTEVGRSLMARGFLRVRCDACAFERLVPLSCKGPAVCVSCGGRRMAEQPHFPVSHHKRSGKHQRGRTCRRSPPNSL